jgi:tRNA nucleotidyltransferase/poly(A) polymerase
MNISPSNTLPFSPLLGSIRECLSHDQKIYLVGGALRDALLGRQSTDLDFVVPSGGIQLGRHIARELGADFYPLDEERDTGRVLLRPDGGHRLSLDFAAFRGASLEDDLRARDFRMNAMAFDLHSEQIIDPLHGSRDIAARIIHVCSADSLREDPVRIIRAVRQAVELGFQIAPGTRRNMKKAVKRLSSVSPERLRDELFRILGGHNASSAIASMEILGLLPFVLPELPHLKDVTQSEPHQYDVWNHTLAVMKVLDELLAILTPGYDPEGSGDLFSGMLVLRLGRYRDQFRAHFESALTTDRPMRALLFYAALYHDVGKPQCVSTGEDGRIRFLGHEEKGTQIALGRARSLHLSNAEIERLQSIIRNHMRIHTLSNRLVQDGQPPSRKAIYKFFNDTGEAGVDLVLLALADVRATHAHLLSQKTWAAVLDVSRVLLENFWEKPEETVSPPPLLDGNEIMGVLDLDSGPQIGAVLKVIREAQATGKVTTREEAVALSREWKEKQV